MLSGKHWTLTLPGGIFICQHSCLLWSVLDVSEHLCGEKFIVNHMLPWWNMMLWGNTSYRTAVWSIFCSPSHMHIGNLKESLPWRTLSCCLIAFHLFAFLDLPQASLVLLKLLESEFGCRYHILSGVITTFCRTHQCSYCQGISGKTLESPDSDYPSILSIWSCWC